MKKKHLFMSATIMCGLLAVAFVFKANQIDWLWSDNKPVAIVLGILTIVFGKLWFKYRNGVNQL
jgi:hypothetical protein